MVGLIDAPLTLEDKANLLLAATHANQSCFQAADLMYSAAGTSGIYMKNKLAQFHRHTSDQAAWFCQRKLV